MKIAWLAPYPVNLLTPELKTSRSKTGHACSWIVNLSDELAKKSDISLHIITRTALIPYNQTVKKNNITFHIIKYRFPFTKNKGFPSYFPLDVITRYKTFTKEALKILRKIKPDIIHAFGTENAYAITVCQTNIPSIISLQGIISEIFRVSPSFFYFLQSHIEKLSIRKNYYFGCRTDFDTGFVRRVNRDAKIYYMQEAIGNVFFDKSWRNKDDKSIIYVGSLVRRKGIERLLKSLSIVKKKIPDAKLRVIGNGPKKYLRHLQKIAVSLSIEKNVIWYGYQDSTQIAQHLSTSTIFVLPTSIDNSPNTLAEAMAVGVPSIASKVGGIPSMVNNGVDGILVDCGNVYELANKILVLMEDRELQRKISINAKKSALKRNFPDNVAKETVETYNQILSLERMKQS